MQSPWLAAKHFVAVDEEKSKERIVMLLLILTDSIPNVRHRNPLAPEWLGANGERKARGAVHTSLFSAGNDGTHFVPLLLADRTIHRTGPIRGMGGSIRL
jgi:hypothetical protein